MAPFEALAFVVLEGFEDLECCEVPVVLELLEVLDVFEAFEGLEQPGSIRPNPARSPKLDRRRLRAIVELLFSALTTFAS